MRIMKGLWRDTLAPFFCVCRLRRKEYGAIFAGIVLNGYISAVQVLFVTRI